MRIQPEGLPETVTGCEFPIGDIADAVYEHASQWLDECESPEYADERKAELVKKLRGNREWLDTTSATAGGTFADVSKLCKTWESSKDESTSRIGFWMAHCLNTQSGLASDYSDFSEEMEVIGEQGKDYSRVLGKTAWQDMQHSHPRVHSLYNRLNQLLAEAYYLTGDEVERQKAGMALGYLVAVHSALLASESEVSR